MKPAWKTDAPTRELEYTVVAVLYQRIDPDAKRIDFEPIEEMEGDVIVLPCEIIPCVGRGNWTYHKGGVMYGPNAMIPTTGGIYAFNDCTEYYKVAGWMPWGEYLTMIDCGGDHVDS